MLVTLCLRDYHGTARALRAVAGLFPGARALEVRGGVAEVEFLRDWIRATRPGLLLLGAWSPLYREFLDCAPRTAVYWTSSVVQTDLAAETLALAEILQDPGIERVFCSCPSLAQSLGTSYLPVLTTLPGGRPLAHEGNRVSLLASAPHRARKGFLPSLLALRALRLPFTLVSNGLTDDPAYRAFLPSSVEDRGWLSSEDYLAAVASTDVGLQLTLSDSWNQVASDHLGLGIPVVGTPMLPVLQALPAPVRRALTVENLDRPELLTDRLHDLLGHPERRRELGERARRALGAVEKKRRQRVLEELSRCG